MYLTVLLRIGGSKFPPHVKEDSTFSRYFKISVHCTISDGIPKMFCGTWLGITGLSGDLF